MWRWYVYCKINYVIIRYNIDCTQGDVRVVGSDSTSYGTVEVCVNGIWGLITDNNWDDIDSIVICRQLGFEYNLNSRLIIEIYWLLYSNFKRFYCYT